MSAIKPLKLDSANYPANAQTGDFIDIPNGGTGATTALGARTALGLAIGSDIMGYSTDLSALTALNTTVGIPARTATDTWAMRTLTGSTRISVTNGTGAAGNPTFDLTSYSNSGAGTFLKFTRDSQGLVSGTTPVVAGDITALVNGTYAPINNPTFTGTVTLAADPASALQAATKQYVDSVVSAGVAPFDSVARVAVANVTLSGEQTIDGVLTSATRILLTAQTTASQNGIYVTAAGAWTRSTDCDASSDFEAGKQVFVTAGTTYTGSVWANTNTTAVTVGTTAVTFTQINGANQITAGAGLAKTGNTLDVGTASTGRIVVNADNIDLASGIVTPGTYTKITVDTYGRATTGATATAADVGAQPSDAGLTSLAALTGGGSVHATATDTFVMRTLTGTAGRVGITNGDGVAGNPTVDLVSGVVAPGTYESVTVDTYGRVTAGSAGTAAEAVLTPMNNSEASAIVMGRAVYVFSGGNVKLANANASGTRLVVGLVGDASINAAASGNIATAGVLVASTAQWDVVTGQTGGLTAGSTYYLSNATNGALTTTAPTTGYSAPIGVAMSTTRMKINIWQPVQL